MIFFCLRLDPRLSPFFSLFCSMFSLHWHLGSGWNRSRGSTTFQRATSPMWSTSSRCWLGTASTSLRSWSPRWCRPWTTCSRTTSRTSSRTSATLTSEVAADLSSVATCSSSVVWLPWRMMEEGKREWVMRDISHVHRLLCLRLNWDNLWHVESCIGSFVLSSEKVYCRSLLYIFDILVGEFKMVRQ